MFHSVIYVIGAVFGAKDDRTDVRAYIITIYLYVNIVYSCLIVLNITINFIATHGHEGPDPVIDQSTVYRFSIIRNSAGDRAENSI